MKISYALIVCFLVSGCTRRVNSYVPPQTPADIIAGAEAVVKAVPSYDNWMILGLAYSRAGQSRQAIDAWKNAVKVEPRSSLAFNNLCSEYAATKEWDLATESCQQALQLEPTMEIARNNLEGVKSAKAVNDARIAALEEAAKSPDLNARGIAGIELGLEYYGRGDNEKALIHWARVPEKSSNYAVAQNNMASAFILLKRFTEARKAIDRALKLDPNNTLFLNNEKWLLSASRQTQ